MARRSVARASVAGLLVIASAAGGVACSSGEADTARDATGEDAGAPASSADASIVLPGRPIAGDGGDPTEDAAVVSARDASGDVPSLDASTTRDTAPDATDASTPDSAAPADTGVVVPTGPGHVVYRLPDGRWRMIAATAGARALDVSGALDAISAGVDNGASLGVDGAWIALDTTRAGCSGDCLALATSSGSQLSLVRTGGMETQLHARPAVGPGGITVVYPVTTSVLRSDLFASESVGGVWSAPRLLTASSAYASHHDIAFSFDGTRVVFDCAPSDYQAPGGAICEAPSMAGRSGR